MASATGLASGGDSGHGRNRTNRRAWPSSAAGFTMIEMLITIAVAAILLAIALPSYRETILRQNTTQTANGLITDLNLARAEAVRRGSLVEVASTSGGSGWTNGWTVIAANASSGSFDSVNGGATVIKTSNTLPSQFTVCGKATTASTPAGNNAIVFNSIGALSGAGTMDFSVVRPDRKLDQSIHITVSGSGRIQSITSVPSGLGSC